jgi:SHS2 domain-containing protein
MTKQPFAGYKEIEHTADWELEVWAPDLCALLKQAALGMYELAGAEIAQEPLEQCHFSIEFFDSESLLVEFLSELLFYGETKQLGFNHFQLTLGDNMLSAAVSGAPLIRLNKEIKAVTYHNLAIRETEQGLQTRIVFDV